jgi:uncharacterized protein (TIGR03437 family)
MKAIRAAAVIMCAVAVAPAQQYVISTFAGGGPPPTPATGASMGIAPQGLASDNSGNLFFVSANCVFKMDAKGIVTRVAGNGRPGYAGDGGPALTAEFKNPSALVLDAAGNVYVTDSGNQRVRVISPAGLITTVAGTGVAGYSGDGGSALSAELRGPGGLGIDPSGNLFIVDYGRIRKVSPDGTIATVAGTGTPGFSGDGGPATSAAISPYGIALDNKGTLFISDDGNLRVRKVSPDGIITTVAGTGVWGMSGDGGPATSAQLTGASGIALDSAGNVYFTDSSPESDDYDCSCIRRISPAGTISIVAGGEGFFNPRWIAIDAANNIYVANSGYRVISKIAQSGGITIAAGNGESANFSGDGGAAMSAQFMGPGGVAVDAAGNTYIADTFNNRVRMVSPDGKITTIAGDGTPAYLGEGVPAAISEIYFPVGIAADGQGDLYIADHGNSRIRKISRSGIITTVSTLNGPQVWNLAVDTDGNLFYPDPANNRIIKVTHGGVTSTVAGNGTHGYSGDGGPATAAQIRLTDKAAIAVDNQGNLYFSDDDVQPPLPGIAPSQTSSSPRIRKVSADGIITTVAGNGTSGFSGDGGPAIQAQLGSQLNFPVALAVDPSGNLFIGDGDNRRIRMVTKDGIITTIAGTSRPGYSGDGGPATSAQLDAAAGLAVDASGQIYVADQYNDVIRLMQPVSRTIGIAGLANAASGQAGPISPGEIVVISGSMLGPAQLVSATPGSNGLYPTEIAGTTVKINGTSAPLIYAWATQIAAVVPYSIVGGPAEITVSYHGQISAPLSGAVASSAPGVFTLDSSGKGQATAINQDGSINSPANPAKPGSVVSLFMTGAGESTPAATDGSIASPPLPTPVLEVSATIGGNVVLPVYAGAVAGQVSGLVRIDIQIPTSLTGAAVPVSVQVGSNSSQAAVTVSIQ